MPVLAFLSSRCCEVSEVGRTLKFCDIYSHVFRANLWLFCECNPAIPCRGLLNVST